MRKDIERLTSEAQELDSARRDNAQKNTNIETEIDDLEKLISRLNEEGSVVYKCSSPVKVDHLKRELKICQDKKGDR